MLLPPYFFIHCPFWWFTVFCVCGADTVACATAPCFHSSDQIRSHHFSSSWGIHFKINYFVWNVWSRSDRTDVVQFGSWKAKCNCKSTRSVLCKGFKLLSQLFETKCLDWTNLMQSNMSREKHNRQPRMHWICSLPGAFTCWVLLPWSNVVWQKLVSFCSI